MTEQITISLPDGSAREYAAGTTAGDVATSIGKRLGKAAVAATVVTRVSPTTRIEILDTMSADDLRRLVE